MTVALIDLFSGSGGLSLGFNLCRRAEFVPALAVDANSSAIGSFKENFPDAKALRKTLEPTMTVNEAYAMYRGYVPRGHAGVVLLASPPCESFSNGASTKRHVDDARNYLFRVVLRYAAATRPLAIVIENVRQMRGLHGGQMHDELVSGLEALAYRVTPMLLNAAAFGVPQRRVRLFYLAVQEDLLSGRPEAPEETHSDDPSTPGLLPIVTVREAIGDLPARGPGSGALSFVSRVDPDAERDRLGYYAAGLRVPSGERVFHHISRTIRDTNLKRVRALQPGQAMEDLPKRLRPKQGFPGSYGRLDPGEPAFTLTSNFSNPGSGRYFHYSQDRLISLREGARLQGFPDRYRWHGYYEHVAEQVGDAVPPPLAHAIAHKVAAYLISAGVIEASDAVGDTHCVFRHLEVPHPQDPPTQAAQLTVRTTVA